MDLAIHDWIEITYASDGEAPDDTMWMGVTRLAPLVDVPDKFTEAVFGFSKAAVANMERVSPVASNRGVPTACSSELRDDIARIRDHERQYGSRVSPAASRFVSYAELMRVNGDSVAVRPQESEWSTVFSRPRRVGISARPRQDPTRHLVGLVIFDVSCQLKRRVEARQFGRANR